MTNTSLGALVVGVILGAVGAMLVRSRNLLLNILGIVLLLGGVVTALGAIPAIGSSVAIIITSIIAILAGGAMMADGGKTHVLKTVVGLVVLIVGVFALLNQLGGIDFLNNDLGTIFQRGLNQWRRLWNSAETGLGRTR